jgi:hypothetical protein
MCQQTPEHAPASRGKQKIARRKSTTPFCEYSGPLPSKREAGTTQKYDHRNARQRVLSLLPQSCTPSTAEKICGNRTSAMCKDKRLYKILQLHGYCVAPKGNCDVHFLPTGLRAALTTPRRHYRATLPFGFQHDVN